MSDEKKPLKLNETKTKKKESNNNESRSELAIAIDPLLSTSSTLSASINSESICSICLQPYTYPVKLPSCNHIFCFLCIKGFACANLTPTKHCALCRTSISDDYFDEPILVETLSEDDEQDNHDNNVNNDDKQTSYHWYYKSNNSEAWWKYDKNSNIEIEKAYNLYLCDNTKYQFKIIIAGNIYIIDFTLNLQIRENNRHLKRKIKRDRISIDDLIGIAGLKITNKKKTNNSNDNSNDFDLLTNNLNNLKLN